jgi:hypothetical protein
MSTVFDENSWVEVGINNTIITALMCGGFCSGVSIPTNEIVWKSFAICDFPRENEELQLEQELSRQSDSKIGTT